MQLSILLAVVATIMISENAPAEPVGAESVRLLLTLGASLSVVLFATWGSFTISRVVRADTSDRQYWALWFRRLQQWHLVFWLATIAIVVYGLHWPQIVRYNWGLDKTLLIRDLLILAPVWGPLLCSWAVFYEVESALRCGRAGRTTFRDTESPQIVGRGPFVWLRARHYLGLCLLPVLTLLAFQDLVSLIRPGWPESEFGWLLYLVPIVGVTLVFPLLLSRIWRTEPLPHGALRTQLTQLTDRVGVRTRDFRIWQTNGQMLNAAVTGLFPSLRYVFITDGLLALLHDNETESVVAHELGHIRRWHLWLRILLLTLPIWVMGNVQVHAPAFGDYCTQWLTQLFGDQAAVNSMIIPALTVTYAALAMGRYSRMLEHDADLCVYDAGQAEAFCTTLDRLSYLSNDRRQRRGWLHPSTVARVHLLQRAQHDPDVARRFRRKVNGCNWVLVAIWIVTPIVLMVA